MAGVDVEKAIAKLKPARVRELALAVLLAEPDDFEDLPAPQVMLRNDGWTGVTTTIDGDGYRAVLITAGGRRTASRSCTVIDPEGVVIGSFAADAAARIAAVTTAALVAPFKPKDAELFSIISGFDAAYGAYNSYQNGIERYWTLKYLQQNGITELVATAFKDDLVRTDALPLVLPATGALGLPRGAKVRIKLGEIDEITDFDSLRKVREYFTQIKNTYRKLKQNVEAMQR